MHIRSILNLQGCTLLCTEILVLFVFKSKQENAESSIQNGKVENDSTDVVDGDDDTQNRNIPRPSSAKGQRRRPKNENGDGRCSIKYHPGRGRNFQEYCHGYSPLL